MAQYVILGAGLDTFAQRRQEVAARLRVFEVGQPGPQAWKRQRLIDLGYGVPDWLRLVPTDFEAGEPWLERLAAAGFADVRHVPGTSLVGRYFADRADGLRPSSGEDLLVAAT